jgi:predicted  nucleic acid-binding Zn-ribbon protein
MQTNNPQSVNAMAIPNMTTSVVPVNMDEQERQKLERKRERNRLAATKCRQRKIQKINVLEQEVQVLTERNNNLKNERRHLREELQRLESQLGIPNNSAQIYA